MGSSRFGSSLAARQASAWREVAPGSLHELLSEPRAGLKSDTPLQYVWREVILGAQLLVHSKHEWRGEQHVRAV
jgi:hypothetical protein